MINGDKHNKKIEWKHDYLQKIRKYLVNFSTLIVAIICIIVLEIIAFKTNPYRGFLDLLRDIIAMFVGFFGSIIVTKIEKYIVPEYKLSIAFGFLFLGIGMILSSVFRFGKNLFSSTETYYGLLICILCMSCLISMHEKFKKDRTEK